MSCSHCVGQTDHGPNPYVINIEQTAIQNQNFRTTVWTGCHLQMTVMCIPPCGEIGLEVHPNTDQLISVEQGTAVVKFGECVNRPDFQQNISKGDAVFIPAGTWHNVVNIGRNASALTLKFLFILSPLQ
ncbi:MAG: cupin domain-containing protein [Lachnospiraceae bacterium]|nr:cupin domain-containing protein [Lachnospiraceae bacterium]